MNCHRLSNLTGATSGARSTYPLEAFALPTMFVGFITFRVAQSLDFVVLFCGLFSILLFVLYDIVLSVLRFMAPGYPFVILKLFLGSGECLILY